MPQLPTVKVNRAPVLTLWAAVVAERLGFDPDAALTLGRAVAGLNAYSKGVALGIIQPSELTARRERARQGEALQVDLLRRAVPVVRTPEGVRALAKGRPISPTSVEKYLASKFGDALDEVREAMVRLARSLPPEDLALRAYGLYEEFRPAVPAGERGWGAAGVLDLARLEALARSR
ncbi:MAG TPA: hypothetical protein VFG43_00995 [Geminicoccaceae bacterium]|nr:hypothetical protein [Geminicoccaceae bacterium]